jgi:hypothetical protein
VLDELSETIKAEEAEQPRQATEARQAEQSLVSGNETEATQEPKGAEKAIAA